MKFIVGGSIDRRTGEITDIYADCTEAQADAIVRNILGIQSMPARPKPKTSANAHGSDQTQYRE